MEGTAYLPQMGYKKRIHLMNPMVPGLTGGKMSASLADSKIDLLDPPEKVRAKLANADCGMESGVVAFVRHVIFSLLRGKEFQVPLESGEVRTYNSPDDVINALVSQDLPHTALKSAVAEFIIKVLEPIQETFRSPELVDLSARAYPPAKEVEEALNDLNVDGHANNNNKQEDGCYLRVSPAEKPALDLLVPLSQLKQLVAEGRKATVVVEDVESYLDGGKMPWNLAPHRGKYSQHVLESLLAWMGASSVKVIQGSSFQLAEEVILDIYRLASLVSVPEAKQALASLQADPTAEPPQLGCLVVPLVQALTRHKLGVPLEVEGHQTMDDLVEKCVVRLGYATEPLAPVLHYSPVPNLSSLEEEAKILLTDEQSAVKRKLKRAFCEPGNVTVNPVLELAHKLVYPITTQNGIEFVVERKPEFGGNLVYTDPAKMTEDFKTEVLHPGDLKSCLEKKMVALIQSLNLAKKESKELESRAFPKVSAKKGAAAAQAAEAELTPNRLDIRVGCMVEVGLHPEADSLYLCRVDVGEAEGPRQVVAGLAHHIPIDQLQGRLVVVLCNLKPAKVRGVESRAMILCASTPELVEPLQPPANSQPGAMVSIPGAPPATPDPILNPKKKVWEKLQVDLKTSESCAAQWQDLPLETAQGPITCPTLKNAPIK
ncbi:YARS [Cordylochernes scorpioides]|uniref:YARS n=1 Tax=Cordylochernes scorpioides TaxID=51811 RepID=A0ABY6LNA0_9ARAC|nr:YARS [Cordylochernes scorpioides]